MHPLIFAGLKSPGDKLIEAATWYLNLSKDLESSSPDVAALKKMCSFILKKEYGMSASQIGESLGLNNNMVRYHNRPVGGSKELYLSGENKLYEFIYLNVVRKNKGLEYFNFQDLFDLCIPEFPKTNDMLFYDAKPFVIYFSKNMMSTNEIVNILEINNPSLAKDLDLHNKSLYIDIINAKIEMIINQLKRR